MAVHTHHIIFLIAAILLTLLLAIVWKRHTVRSGQIFLLLLSLALMWNVTFLLELSLSAVDTKILMVQFQFLAIAFIPPAWFFFTALYTGFPITRFHVLVLSIIPVITSILVWLVPQPNWF